MRTDRARRATATGPDVTVEIAQGAGERAARGTVRIAGSDLTLESVALGVLQVAPGWASVTGRARMGAEVVPFTLVVDTGHPQTEGQVVLVAVPGRPLVRHRVDRVAIAGA